MANKAPTGKGNRGQGRKKGVPNKATADLKALAQVHTAAAIDTLVTIMETGESEQARTAAANALLDRGHGKAAQSVTAEHSGTIELIITETDNWRAQGS